MSGSHAICLHDMAAAKSEMVVGETVIDIDDYPRITEFKTKALTSTERVLLARKGARTR